MQRRMTQGEQSLLADDQALFTSQDFLVLDSQQQGNLAQLLGISTSDLRVLLEGRIGSHDAATFALPTSSLPRDETTTARAGSQGFLGSARNSGPVPQSSRQSLYDFVSLENVQTRNAGAAGQCWPLGTTLPITVWCVDTPLTQSGPMASVASASNTYEHHDEWLQAAVGVEEESLRAGTNEESLNADLNATFNAENRPLHTVSNIHELGLDHSMAGVSSSSDSNSALVFTPSSSSRESRMSLSRPGPESRLRDIVPKPRGPDSTMPRSEGVVKVKTSSSSMRVDALARVYRHKKQVKKGRSQTMYAIPRCGSQRAEEEREETRLVRRLGSCLRCHRLKIRVTSPTL